MSSGYDPNELLQPKTETPESIYDDHSKFVNVIQLKEDGLDFQINEKPFEKIIALLPQRLTAVYLFTGEKAQNNLLLLKLLLLCYNDVQTQSKGFPNEKDAVLILSQHKDEPETQPCLWLWNEPLIISTNKGEVAVFLMYTHIKHENEMRHWIAALSCSTTSVIIYNVLNQIDLWTLQQLQLFSRSAKLITEQQTTNTFQDLILNIGEWPDPEFEYGFNGGSKVLRTLLDEEITSPELKSLWSDIDCSFENISCFLMPHPGQTAAREITKERGFAVKDFDEEFLKYVYRLSQTLFMAESVIIKKINGQPATGETLLTQISQINEMCKKSDLMSIKTTMEAGIEARLDKITSQLSESYSGQMTQLCSQGYIEEQVLHQHHLQFKNDAIHSFDDYPKLGSPELITKHKLHLSAMLENHLVQYSNLNATQLKILQKKLKEEELSLQNTYISTLEAHYKSEYVDQETFHKTELVTRETIFDDFSRRTVNYPTFLIDSARKQLALSLDIAYNGFQGFITNKLEEESRQLTSAFNKALEIYLSTMEKICGKVLSPADFSMQQKLAFENSMKLFDETAGSKLMQKRSHFTDKLIKQIREHEDAFKEANRINIESQKFLINETIQAALYKYETLMGEECGNQYHGPSELQEIHSKCKSGSFALFVPKTDTIDPTFVEKYKTDLDEKIQQKFLAFNKKDQNIKETLTEKSDKIFNDFKEDLKKWKVGIMRKSSLKNLYQTAREKAIKNFELSDNKDNDFKSQLIRNMEVHFKDVENWHDERAKQLDHRFANLLEDKSVEYRNMVQNASFVNENEINQHHEEFKVELNKEACEIVGTPLSEAHQKRIRDELGQLKKYFFEENLKRRSGCCMCCM